MSNYNYAIILDNLYPSEDNKKLLQYLNNFLQYDLILFLCSKENMLPSNFPVFSIADYFNFTGVSIILNEIALEKTIKYPAVGPRIMLGKNYQDYISVDKLDFGLIEKAVNEYYARHNQNVSSTN